MGHSVTVSTQDFDSCIHGSNPCAPASREMEHGIMQRSVGLMGSTPILCRGRSEPRIAISTDICRLRLCVGCVPVDIYASVAQLVEATGLNLVKCRFDSYPKHQ